MKKYLSVLMLFAVSLNSLNAQLVLDAAKDPKLLDSHWEAYWVAVPDTDPKAYGVYFFRNTMELKEVPEKFIVHLSADNRYKLYINEKLIGLGPARSDLDNWNYESYDLSPYLRAGKNTVAAEVWNFGSEKPWAQLSLYTGFIMQGNGELESALNTPGTWKCIKSDAYVPITNFSDVLGTFIIVGPGDEVDGKLYPWGWKGSGFDDTEWRKPTGKYAGAPKGVGTDITHALVPRTIPAMEMQHIEAPVIREIDNNYIRKTLHDLTIPANSSTSILLDQQYLVNAYPELVISGGEDAAITVGYSETLFNAEGKKEHRDSIEHMLFKGNFDIFKADGMKMRTYSTLWFRTFRYVQLKIETRDQPLTIHSFTPVFTAYPFEEKAWFESDNELLSKIWETGWRTSRLCANELFYDCPYYEQMQYVGDTRIQALISLYVSGDDRLMRKAIDDYYNSMIPEGLTQSRYPTEPRQVIPTYSLFWVSMIHDYMTYRPDYMFASKYLVSIQHVLQWFENRIDEETGMLGAIEYWPFVDWTSAWPWDNDKRIGGVPAGGQTGNSSIITLQYAMTLDQAADIFSYFGLEDLAKSYLSTADELVEATKSQCWDETRQLFADTPEKKEFSQHANIFAVLTNAVPRDEQALLIERVARSEDLIETSYYFRFYLNQAMIKAGLGNKYISMLDPWEDMLDMGLTTFAEMHDLAGTRSDCHAWSSSPLYEFLATLAGIRPAEFGFRSVIIEPHPGSLNWIKAGVPHYGGNIELNLKFDKKGSAKGELTLPEGMTGVFVWDRQTTDLNPGENKISVAPLNTKFKSD